WAARWLRSKASLKSVGSGISAASTSCGSRSSSSRHTVVLPLPMSPVRWRIVPSCSTPCSRYASAFVWHAPRKTKRRSARSENGASRSPKCLAYDGGPGGLVRSDTRRAAIVSPGGLRRDIPFANVAAHRLRIALGRRAEASAAPGHDADRLPRRDRVLGGLAHVTRRPVGRGDLDAVH